MKIWLLIIAVYSGNMSITQVEEFKTKKECFDNKKIYNYHGKTRQIVSYCTEVYK